MVLPCVPPIAIADFGRISSASISARRTTGRPRARASDQLRVVALDRRGDDDDRRVAEILRVVADRDLDAAVAQPLHVGAVGDVRAAHAVVLVGQHLGDAAHSDPADPDEMDRADVARQFHQKISGGRIRARLHAAYAHGA